MTLRPVTDLKNIQPVRHRSGDTRKEKPDVYWQADIFTSHGLHAPAHLSSLCYPLSREQQRQNFHLSRPISLHGLCSTDISGESPRYRSMSSSTAAETVPHGHSRHSRKVKSCRCKRTERLAHICRSRPFIDHHRSRSLQQAFEFLIQLIKQKVRKQRRQRPALRCPFSCRLVYFADHCAAFKIAVYQLQQPCVLHLFFRVNLSGLHSHDSLLLCVQTSRSNIKKVHRYADGFA